MNRYSPRRTTQSPLLRHFSVSLRNNSQPSNEVLLREYQFITPIITEYLIYVTIALFRAPFVTIWGITVTINLSSTTIVTEYLIYMTITRTRAPFVTDWGVIMTITFSTAPIVTKYLIYMTIPLPRMAFVTDSSVFVTIPPARATFVTD